MARRDDGAGVDTEVSAIVRQLVDYTAMAEAGAASVQLLSELHGYQEQCWQTEALKLQGQKRRAPRGSATKKGKKTRKTSATSEAKPAFGAVDLTLSGRKEADSTKRWLIKRLAELSRLQIETSMKELRRRPASNDMSFRRVPATRTGDRTAPGTSSGRTSFISASTTTPTASSSTRGRHRRTHSAASSTNAKATTGTASATAAGGGAALVRLRRRRSKLGASTKHAASGTST